jgi:hypothetical protein
MLIKSPWPAAAKVEFNSDLRDNQMLGKMPNYFVRFECHRFVRNFVQVRPWQQRHFAWRCSWAR